MHTHRHAHTHTHTHIKYLIHTIILIRQGLSSAVGKLENQRANCISPVLLLAE